MVSVLKPIAITCLTASGLLVLVFINAQIALLAGILTGAAPLVIYAILRYPLLILQSAIIAIPFTVSEKFNPELMGVNGLNLSNLLIISALVAAISHRIMERRRLNVLEWRVVIFFSAYFVLWTIAFVRSVPNYEQYFFIYGLTDKNILYYILSSYVQPSLFASLFISVFFLSKGFREISSVLTALSIAIMMLSSVIIIIFIAYNDVIGQDRRALNHIFEMYLGAHYNRIGTIYITVGPLLTYLAVRKGLFAGINFLFALVCLLIIGSRAALLTYILFCGFTLIVMRRLLIVLAGVVGIATCIAFLNAPSINALLSVGVGSSGEITSFDALLARRYSTLWAPLIVEWWENPVRFWLGAGLRPVLSSDLWSKGLIYRANFAHNAFLDMLLSVGVVLGLGFLAYLMGGVYAAWNQAKRLKNNLIWALLFCILSYILAAVTGRIFLPRADNLTLFVIVAIILKSIDLCAKNLSAAVRFPTRVILLPQERFNRRMANGLYP